MIRMLLAVALISVSPIQAYAWGSKGHRAVAIIAERHLTPEAYDAVTELLESEGKTSMQEVALWADNMKDLAIPKQPSHSVFLKGDDTPYNAKRDCAKNRCIIGALEASIEVLETPDAPVEAHAAALKYVVHFVGDIHMPLHATKLGRGVPVTFEGKKLTLHKVWDSQILADEKGAISDLADRIEQRASRYEDGNFGDPVEWALEGRAITRDIIMPNLPEKKDGKRIVLSADYMQENLPIVYERVNLAGRRLADLLNRIYASRTQ